MNPTPSDRRTAESAWIREAVALFRKDLQAELRTKVAVSAVGVFTFASLLLMAIATAALKEALALRITRIPDAVNTGDLPGFLSRYLVPAWDSPTKMGLLWVLLCFAAFTGLAHSFVHEEETGTVTALRLSMSPGAVYAGKLAFNVTLLLAVTALVTPAYMVITGMSAGSPVVFVSVMLCGCIGLAGAATIIAALAAKARGTGALFGAIGLPLLIVFLLMLLNAAGTVYVVNPPLVRVVKDVGGLLSFGVLLIAISAITFHFVWEE